MMQITQLSAQKPLLDSTYLESGNRLESESFSYQTPTNFNITKRPLRPAELGKKQLLIYNDSLLHELLNYNKLGNLVGNTQMRYDQFNRRISTSTESGNNQSFATFTYKDSSDIPILSHLLRIDANSIVRETKRKIDYDNQNRIIKNYYVDIEKTIDTLSSILFTNLYYKNGVRKYSFISKGLSLIIDEGYALNEIINRYNIKDTLFEHERIRFWDRDSTFWEDRNSQTYMWGEPGEFSTFGSISYRNSSFTGEFQTTEWVGDSLIIKKYFASSKKGTPEDYRNHIKNNFQLISRMSYLFNQFNQPILQVGYTKFYNGKEKRPYLKKYFYKESNSVQSEKATPQITVLAKLNHKLIYYDLSGRIVTNPSFTCQLIEVNLSNNTSQRVLYIPY